jgi:Transaldolase/Fructose-6-phosphate aldolase
VRRRAALHRNAGVSLLYSVEREKWTETNFKIKRAKLFRDHGRVQPTLEAGEQDAGRLLARLAELGIDLGAITEKLLADGITAFTHSLDELLASLKENAEYCLKVRQPERAKFGALALRDLRRDKRDSGVFQRVRPPCFLLMIDSHNQDSSGVIMTSQVVNLQVTASISGDANGSAALLQR